MPSTIVLAVDLDPLMLGAHRAAWESAGYILTPTHSIKETLACFKVGDFDLVLLGPSLPVEDKERMTFLIRTLSSRTPVLSIMSSPASGESFADATVENDSGKILDAMGKVMTQTDRASVQEYKRFSSSVNGTTLNKGIPSGQPIM